VELDEFVRKGRCLVIANLRWAGVISALAVLTLLVMSSSALAAAGSLDATFDGDGRVITDLGSPEEGAEQLAIQPDGKIVVVASSRDQDTFVTTWVLIRYDSSGALDPTFDGDGILVVHGMTPNDVAVQSDGKIVVAGLANIDLGDAVATDFAVARFNPGGTPDTTFSDDGIATADFNGGEDIGLAVALQTDGKIVVVGSTAPNFTGRDFAIARFNDGGTLDTSFSGDGLLRMSLFGGNDRANAVAIQTNGRIVVAGETHGAFDSSDFGLARFRADGRRDLSFSGDGKLRTSFGPFDRAFDVGLQADGKIVAGGSAYGRPAGVDFALARYTPRGRLDPTFSKDGKQRTDFTGGNDEAHGLVIQPNGRIVLSGSAAPPHDPDDVDFGLARYRASGRLDLSFSGDGKQRTRFGTNHQDYGFDAALQADGRIVVVGSVTPLVNGYDVGLARYLTS
jgi:uncharacterized delta-60 repeat protein